MENEKTFQYYIYHFTYKVKKEGETKTTSSLRDQQFSVITDVELNKQERDAIVEKFVFRWDSTYSKVSHELLRLRFRKEEIVTKQHEMLSALRNKYDRNYTKIKTQNGRIKLSETQDLVYIIFRENERKIDMPNDKAEFSMPTLLKGLHANKRAMEISRDEIEILLTTQPKQNVIRTKHTRFGGIVIKSLNISIRFTNGYTYGERGITYGVITIDHTWKSKLKKVKEKEQADKDKEDYLYKCKQIFISIHKLGSPVFKKTFKSQVNPKIDSYAPRNFQNLYHVMEDELSIFERWKSNKIIKAIITKRIKLLEQIDKPMMLKLNEYGYLDNDELKIALREMKKIGKQIKLFKSHLLTTKK